MIKSISAILKNRKFPFVAQHDSMDCGPACLAMVSKYFGKSYSLQQLRQFCHLSKDGVSLLGIEDGAKYIGLEVVSVKITVQDLIDKKPLPAILYWNNNHFVVLYKVRRNVLTGAQQFYIKDPSYGKMVLDLNKFKNLWAKGGNGIALLMNPTSSFYKKKAAKQNSISFSSVVEFLVPHKRELFILILGLLFSSIFSLIFPFLTKALIDIGVDSKNLNYIFIILLAQIFLFLGSMAIEIIRNWVLVFINSKINISIISKFLSKIIKLPLNFFDAKQLGDFSARIGDHQRIEEFLTSQSLIVIFSSLNFLVFFIVLTYFDPTILLVYSSLTFLSVLWSLVYLKKLKKTDYYRFRYQSESQQAIYELINGIVEVKLNNFEDHKVSKWRNKQIKLFNINLRVLRLDQFQNVGYDFINQIKNILVIFIAAREVITGNITLGALLSISYIVGQMNGPLNQLIEFLRSWQYAKLSFERLYEVQNMNNEDDRSMVPISKAVDNNPHSLDIKISNVSFHYNGPRSPKVLDSLNFSILSGKTTAIVGESGSGKTTLMKLLLKFYKPTDGVITFGDEDINSLSAKDLRKNCGVVMQDGYIFSDTLEQNIVTGDEPINKERLKEALRIANLDDYIETLPQGLKTILGSGGNGISGGQKQRILISRAVYKNPQFIFFDEATSSLDAENERIIYENLDSYFQGRTVLKIAHRLSTVMNAHQIIVLQKGKIVEIGTHTSLIQNKSNYYQLVKNQLELSA
ncbi:MAG: peptidase domain-containing ABC transporter [Salegentibacter mishustinae]|nr:peptidase domain-containing ABC transporter [Salegentibacter mishustinae]